MVTILSTMYHKIIFSGPAYKACTENGQWWRHPETNMTWSNYTQCVNIQDLEVSSRICFLFHEKNLFFSLFSSSFEIQSTSFLYRVGEYHYSLWLFPYSSSSTSSECIISLQVYNTRSM